MPCLKRLSVCGLVPSSAAADAFPALLCVLESLLWAGGVSPAACAHILAQCGGVLRTLDLTAYARPAALALILSLAPAATLHDVSLSTGAHVRCAQRAPYVAVLAQFLHRCMRVREVGLQLLPGLALADLLADLPPESRLRTLRLRHPDEADAAWLARELLGDAPALAALRAITLVHDAAEEADDDDPGSMEDLELVCDARRIRLSQSA